MFKPGQLVRIKNLRTEYTALEDCVVTATGGVSYVVTFIMENDQRATEEHKNTYSGLTYRRPKIKNLPFETICLFLKSEQTKTYLLHEDQIVECYYKWLEPL